MSTTDTTGCVCVHCRMALSLRENTALLVHFRDPSFFQSLDYHSILSPWEGEKKRERGDLRWRRPLPWQQARLNRARVEILGTDWGLHKHVSVIYRVVGD